MPSYKCTFFAHEKNVLKYNNNNSKRPDDVVGFRSHLSKADHTSKVHRLVRRKCLKRNTSRGPVWESIRCVFVENEPVIQGQRSNHYQYN